MVTTSWGEIGERTARHLLTALTPVAPIERRIVALGTEQLVRADDVELYDHRRPVHHVLELLQEPLQLAEADPDLSGRVGVGFQGFQVRHLTADPNGSSASSD